MNTASHFRPVIAFIAVSFEMGSSHSRVGKEANL